MKKENNMKINLLNKKINKKINKIIDIFFIINKK